MLALLNTLFAYAINGRTTYQARIIKPDGLPLQSSSVNFRFTVLDQSGSCVLYVEDYAAINMTDTSGLISFPLGTGARSFPTSGTAQTFQNTFDNSITSFACQTMGIYNPNPTDTRKIVMQFNDGSGWQTLPAMSINAVPYAMFATRSDNSRALNGKADTAFVEYSVLNGLGCAADQAIKYNGVSFSCITVGSSGTAVTSSTVIAALGYTPAQGTSFTSLDSTVTSVSSAVYSVSSTVSNLNNSVTSLSSSVAASFAAITSSQWSTSGTSIFYSGGNVGIGSTIPVTKLSVAGGISISMESATCVAGLAGTLRYNSGTVEYCNGTSWLPFGVAGSGITSLNSSTSGTQTFATGITGTVFNISSNNGVHTFNIPLAASSSVVAGLLSNADYQTFANKVSSTSAAVISALGYTPLNDSVSGTYLVKANNLSDLASATVARANLGLGSLATLNFLDLSSSLASGTLSIARLPAFSGDVSSSAGSAVLTLNNVGSGITSGTQYTKVTVDGKGRVISGAQLSSSDVTSALGFTPAQSTSSTQWTTNGSQIYYNAGSVGIGTSAPTEKLEVIGNIRADNIRQRYLTRTIPTTVNDYVEIGSWDGANGSQALDVTISTSSPGFALSKKYLININWDGTAGNWRTIYPIVDSGPYSGNDISLEGRVTTTTLTLRLKRTLGSAAGTADISVAERGNTGITFTSMSATSSDTAITGIFPGTGMLIKGNSVGIGAASPTAILHLTAGTSILAPLKFTSGILLASPQTGTMEYDGTNFYVTDGSNQRRTIATGSSTGSIDNASTINSSGNITLAPTGSVVVSSTTASTSYNNGALVVQGGVGIAGNLNVAGTISGSAQVKATGYRANQGAPNAGDSSANGYSFGADGDTGIFSPGSGGANGVIAFYNNDVERVRIDPSGNVGINTTSPSTALDVGGLISTGVGTTQIGGLLGNNRGVVPNTGLIVAGNTGSSNGGYAQFYGSNAVSGTDDRRGNVDIGSYSSGGTPGNINFYTYNGSSWLSRMMIQGTTGNIGMGTMTPAYKLSVYEGSGNVVHNIESGNNGSAAYTRHSGKTAGGVARTFGNGLNISDGNGAYEIYDFTAGASRMYVNSSGNIGIGTTNPVAKLSISSGTAEGIEFFPGNGAGVDALQFYNRTAGTYDVARLIADSYRFETAGTERMRLTSSGAVGIGTTLPAAPLHVSGTKGVRLESTGSKYGFLHSVGNLHATQNVDFDGAWKMIEAGKAAGFQTNVNADEAFRVFADNTSRAAGAVASFNPVMIVKTDGNVGIGTNTPNSKLDVNGIIGTTWGTAFNTSFNGTWNQTTTGYAGLLQFEASTGKFYFWNTPASATANSANPFPVQSMTIDKSGNVGIGTAAPSTKLEVTGGVAATFNSTLPHFIAGSTGNGTSDYNYILQGNNDTGTKAVHFVNSSTRTADGAANSYTIRNDGGILRLGHGGYQTQFEGSSFYFNAGSVGIGTTTPSYKLDVSGTIRGFGITDSSDIRLKKNVMPLDLSLEKILQIEGVSYNWIDKERSEKKQIGFIAQQLEEIYPELVETDKQGMKSVNYSHLVAPLVEAFKALYEKVSGVEREIASLKAENEELKSKVKEFDELKAYICKKDPEAPNCKPAQ